MVSPTLPDPPGEHPDPPSKWQAGQILTVSDSGPWYRLNDMKYPSALNFGRSGRGRFDGPEQGYGILYLGQDLHTCFIESFGRNHTLGVAEAALRTRNLFEFKAKQPLVFVDLSGAGLVRLGADSRLTTGSYTQARKWAQALWEYPDKFDGIRYCSRFDNQRYCYGLFDRTQTNLQEKNLGNLVEQHAQELAQVLGGYGYALL